MPMNKTVEMYLWVVTVFSTAFGALIGFLIKWLYDGATSKENQTMISEHEKRLDRHEADINVMKADISTIKQNGEKILGEIRTVGTRLNDFLKMQRGK